MTKFCVFVSDRKERKLQEYCVFAAEMLAFSAQKMEHQVKENWS